MLVTSMREWQSSYLLMLITKLIRFGLKKYILQISKLNTFVLYVVSLKVIHAYNTNIHHCGRIRYMISHTLLPRWEDT